MPVGAENLFGLSIYDNKTSFFDANSTILSEVRILCEDFRARICNSGMYRNNPDLLVLVDRGWTRDNFL